MPKNKKKFIDKKNATTYNLVQRSLQPIGEDDPDFVPSAPLTREELLARQEEQQQYGIFYSDGYDYLKHLREVSHAGGVLEEQFDFRVGKTASDLILETQSIISGASRPSRAPASTVKFPVGPGSSVALSAAAMLEAAFNDDGADVQMDEEVLAAMKDDFDFEDPSNILDDNFIVQAKGILAEDDGEDFPGLEDDDDVAPDYVDPTKSLHKGRMVEAWIEHQDPAEENPEGGNQGAEEKKRDRNSTATLIKQWVKSRQDEPENDMEDIQEDKKSRFSQYSMTSSVMRRSTGLRLLDDKFEKMMEQYDDEEIGALDLEDLEQDDGKDSLVLNSFLNEKDDRQAIFEAMMQERPTEADPFAMKFQYEDEDHEKKVKVVLELDDDKYDCQSIAETRTNRSFQPKILAPPQKPKRIVLDPKTGIPREMTGARRNRKEADFSSDESSSGSDAESDVLTLISSLSVARPKNETPEERKLRKQTLKGLRRERRIEKKSCRVAFKEEKVRQEKEVANVQRRLKTISMV